MNDVDYSTTIDLLANRWRSAGPLLAGFPLLAQGRPVSVAEIAEAAGTEVGQVERAVDAARCERDAQGRLIDLYGLTLTPTLHRLTIGGKILFSCVRNGDPAPALSGVERCCTYRPDLRSGPRGSRERPLDGCF